MEIDEELDFEENDFYVNDLLYGNTDPKVANDDNNQRESDFPNNESVSQHKSIEDKKKSSSDLSLKDSKDSKRKHKKSSKHKNKKKQKTRTNETIDAIETHITDEPKTENLKVIDICDHSSEDFDKYDIECVTEPCFVIIDNYSDQFIQKAIKGKLKFKRKAKEIKANGVDQLYPNAMSPEILLSDDDCASTATQQNNGKAKSGHNSRSKQKKSKKRQQTMVSPDSHIDYNYKNSEPLTKEEMKQLIEDLPQSHEVFKCVICDSVFDEEIDLMFHQVEKHTTDQLVLRDCPNCSELFPEDSLEIHIKEVHHKNTDLLSEAMAFSFGSDDTLTKEEEEKEEEEDALFF